MFYAQLHVDVCLRDLETMMCIEFVNFCGGLDPNCVNNLSLVSISSGPQKLAVTKVQLVSRKV